MPKCRSCGADIEWITMESGKLMPVDSEKKTFIVVDQVKGAGHTWTGFIPHWSTCPFADQYRKK